MRDLVLAILLPGSLLFGLTSAGRGLIVLNWLCFMRAWTFSYGFFAGLPMFLIGLVLAGVSALIHGKLRFRFPPFLIVHLLFHAWILLSNTQAYKPKQSWDFYTMFMMTLPVASVLIFAILRDLKTWKWVMWTAAGSLGLVAAKVGFATAIRGGAHISSEVDGFVGDNNVLGLTVCLALACLFGLRNTLKGKWTPFVFYPLMAMAFLCIIFTKSRGAFLSMSMILVLSTLASKSPIRNTIVLLATAGIGYLAVPATYFERLNTFENIEEDRSAMDRIFFWGLSFQQAVAHPILGIGLDNHQDYNEEVTPHLLQDGVNHVAHSVYFQVLAETGFVGLAFYLTLVLWTLAVLHSTYRSTRKLGKSRPDLAWVSPVAFWMRNGFIGYLFGSAFLNMLPIDFPWYFMWYSHILPWVLNRELAKAGKTAPEPEPPQNTAPASGAGTGTGALPAS